MRDDTTHLLPSPAAVPAWHCSAADLVVAAPAIPADALCAVIFALLNDNPDWPSLCVVDDDRRIVGLVSRRTCLAILAKPLMLDLYSRRPVVRIMQRSPLVVDMEDSVDAISERIADGAPEALIDGFVIARDGFYAGVASPQSLLLRTVEQARRRAVVFDHARRSAEEASVAKSSFLANLSHEIRTPLNGVLANLELLGLSPITAEQGELLGSATVAANALFEIIGDVLDLSKIEAGKLTIEAIPMRPAAVCRDITVLTATQATQRGLAFTCHIDPSATLPVQGDSTRLRQIVMNLTGNALKFTVQGGIFLGLFRVDADRRRGESAELWVEVADTGIGFSPDKAASLFEPFTQEDASTTRKFGGTGLGLSICRKLAEMMGGSIHADGEPGGGASFWCRLPFAAVGESEACIADIAGMAVMIVCADAAWRERLAGMLAVAGAVVTGIAEVADALGHLRRAASDGRPFEVVAVVQAPGDPATLAVPAALGGLPTVPLMLTPIEEVRLRRRGYGSGYRHFASIPARPEDLMWSMAVAAGRLRPVSAAAALGGDDIAGLVEVLAPVRGARLLVIDDNAMNQGVARRQLARLGFSCDVAGNGREGLEMLDGATYDMVFCDIQMPEMDGYGFVCAVRDSEAAGLRPHLPVVAMTANAMDGDWARCLESGMDDFVSKPVKIERMADVLVRWLLGEAQEPPCRPPPPPPPPPAAPAAAPSAGPIDRAALATLLGEDDDQAHGEVLGMFVEFFPPLMERLRSAAGAQDREALRRHAHAAKGAARNAAAVFLGDLLHRIEGQAAAAEWGELGALVALAADEYRLIESYAVALARRGADGSADMEAA